MMPDRSSDGLTLLLSRKYNRPFFKNGKNIRYLNPVIGKPIMP